MIRPVLKRENPLLHYPSQEVKNFGTAESVIDDLWDTLLSIQALYKFTRGSGISAPQIGEMWRISTVEYDGERHTLINPKIVDHSEQKISFEEGCLSFFDYRGGTQRFGWVTVEAANRQGEKFTIDGEGNFSMLLQHEIDHLDGMLYISSLESGEPLYKVGGMPTIS
jgi:peptide deformylase